MPGTHRILSLLLACAAVGGTVPPSLAATAPTDVAVSEAAWTDTARPRPASTPPDTAPAGDAGNPRVAYFLRYFQGPARDRMTRWLERGASYLPMIRDRLLEARLPGDLAYLPLIESGFSNNAVSRAGATGMWQLMPETARDYGLRVDRMVDERRDPRKATDAAVRHLRALTGEFRSPYLAAAAYNAGAGTLSDGLRLSGTAPPFEDADFFRLSDQSLLPSETSDYVPQLIAASIIAKDPARYGFTLPAAIPSTSFDSVTVTKATRLDTAARIAGVPLSRVRELNPQYVMGITPPSARSVIRVPASHVADLGAKLALLPAERAPAVPPAPPPRRLRHVLVRRGDTLTDIAHRYQVPERLLRRTNALPARTGVRPGQVLVLPGA